MKKATYIAEVKLSKVRKCSYHCFFIGIQMLKSKKILKECILPINMLIHINDITQSLLVGGKREL